MFKSALLLVGLVVFSVAKHVRFCPSVVFLALRGFVPTHLAVGRYRSAGVFAVVRGYFGHFRKVPIFRLCKAAPISLGELGAVFT